MLKNILKLEGAQQLTKNEQKSINGGICAEQRIRTMSAASCANSGGYYLGSNRCLLGTCANSVDVCESNPSLCL
jgi:hypothetical protein